MVVVRGVGGGRGGGPLFNPLIYFINFIYFIIYLFYIYFIYCYLFYLFICLLFLLFFQALRPSPNDAARKMLQNAPTISFWELNGVELWPFLWTDLNFRIPCWSRPFFRIILLNKRPFFRILLLNKRPYYIILHYIIIIIL